MTDRRNPAFVACLILTLVLLNGCSVLPQRAAKTTFMLPSPELLPTGQPPVPLTLRVMTPHAESPLDSTSILVNPEGASIQAYGGVRWSKPAPVLVRDHWIEGLRQNDGLKAVVSGTSEATSDFALSSDLSRFHIYYPEGQAAVVIRLDAHLLESGSNRVLAARRFEVSLPVADRPVESVIEGFGAASQIVTENMAAWLLSVSRELYEGKDQARPLSDTTPSTRE